MKLCAFCGGTPKYKCPKCEKDYCSVECYKCETHLECSEKFYKDCFMEGLKEGDIGGKDKNEVAGMLKELSSIDTNVPDYELEKVFASLNLGRESEELWQMLEPQQKTAFISMHSRHDFSPIIKTWQPWWTNTTHKHIQDEESKQNILKSIPCLFLPPDINRLISHKTPSSSIPFDLVNVLYGYCYVCRLHNGDLLDLLLDSAHAILSISHSFSTLTFDSCLSSIDHCLYTFNKDQPAEDLYVSSHYSVAVLNDVVSILQGGGFLEGHLFTRAALSHLRTLFKKACKAASGRDDASSDRMVLMRAFKKSEFYLSWLHSSAEKMDGVGGLVEVILHTKLMELNKRSVQRDFVEGCRERLKESAGKKLIEEL